MKIKEFNNLTFENKYTNATENAVYLYNYKTAEGSYECYSFESFFVEIVYNKTNRILEIISYEESKDLNKFTGEKIIL